jgi:nicotinamidase-related amidase
MVEDGGKIFIAGTNSAELVDGILLNCGVKLDSNLLFSGKFQQVGKSEWIMHKPRWGAFYKTPLEGHLATMGVSTFVFIGCNYPNCPGTSIYEAVERD